MVFPSTLTTIGNYAFYGCTRLEKIWIDQNVTTIAKNAFSSCSALTIHGVEGSYAQEYAAANSIPFSTELLVYPSSVLSGMVQDEDGNGVPGVLITLYDMTWNKKLGDVVTDANGNWSSDDVIIGHQYRVWVYHVDYTIQQLGRTYEIPETPVAAGTVLAVMRKTVPETVVSDYTYTVLNGAYCQITGYTGTAAAIRLPSEINGYIVQSLGNNVFKDNKTLTTVVFPETIETIGTYVFSGCTSLKDVAFNHSLTNVANYTFNGCTALEQITLPSTITSIGSYAFQNCTSLTDVNMAEGLTSIGRSAFTGCTALESIALPDSVTTIGYQAFSNCSKLSSIHYPIGWTSASSYSGGSTGVNYQGHIFDGCSSLTRIEIPEGTTTIPAYAFNNATYLEEVVFPSTLTTIGSYAFYGCSKLKTVVMNEGLTTIGSNAFQNCTGLQRIELPESLTTLNSAAFAGCTGLAAIEIPGSVMTIGSDAFNGCSALKAVIVNEGTTQISNYAFQNCTGLTDVSLPDGLTTLGRSAFTGCTALESIALPDSVTTIGYQAFSNCSKLSSIHYPIGWTSAPSYSGGSSGLNYQGHIFDGCTSLITIEIPEGVTSIPAYAFNNATYLEEVVFPSTLTTIGNYAFYGCSKLKTVVMNEGLTTIGSNAFQNCTSLKTIELPESLTALNSVAFAGCTGLTAIDIPGSVGTISVDAFNGCSALRTVIVNEGITKVDNYAFQNCTGLTAVSLPDGLTTIGRAAFNGCSALLSMELPDSVTTIGYQAFANCSKLSSIHYPIGWTSAPSYSGGSSGLNYQGHIFDGCTSLIKIEIPEGVTTIPAYAFNNATYLEEVVFPSTLTTIGNYAFYGCTGLKELNLPDSLTAIPAYCFYNCTGLSVLSLPANVTSIGNYAFYGCLGLRVINMNENLKSIGNYAFCGCDGVLSLVLNDGLESISNSAFNSCANLTSVEIPESVTSIGSNVFDGCNKLTIHCYSGSQAHMIGESEGYKIYILDEHDHIFETDVETSPTCTRGGSQILTCSICGYNYIELLDALGHREGEWVVVQEPGCTVEGLRTRSCTVCNEELERAYTERLGHVEGEWTLIKAATCTVDGIRTRSCTVCNSEIERVTIRALGHTEGEWEVISGSCTEGGVRVKYCIVCEGEAQRENLPATGHTWGEWIVESVASVLCDGIEARTCEICQDREEIITDKIIVDYTEDEQYGMAHFVVVDATTLEPVSNANIFISTENDGEAVLTADKNGKLSQVLPVGNVKISVYASGFKTRNISLVIQAGENEIPTIGISSKNLVHGELTAKEMTYEEMIAAGIDVTDPSNQHLYKYALVLEFEPEIDWLSIMYYMGTDGLPVIMDLIGPVPPGGGGGGGSDSGGGGSGPGGGGGSSWSIIYDGCGVGRGVKYTRTTGEVVSVYPVSERFYLIIYGEVHWVKEMYDVELLAINTSQTDTVEDLVAELTLPEGLSLAKMVGEQQSLTQYMGSLDKGESKSVHWYVRGDEEGEYILSAALRGSMLPFGDTFEYTYETQEPLKVYAGSAMRLRFYVPDSAFTGEEYTVRIELENVSHKTLYNVTHAITDVDQYRVTEYSDGMIEIEEYPVTGGTGSIFIPEFRPGDVIVIETTTTIMFESKLMDYKKQQAKNLLSQVEGLMKGFEALETGIGLMFSVDEWISTAVEAVQDYVDDAIITSSEKKQMAQSIIRQLEDLSEELSGDPTAGKTRKVQELKDAGVWDEVQAIIDDPSILDDYSGKDLSKLSAKLSAANAIQMEDFDIYDSLEKIIDMIPVRFKLVSAWVATLEESTTVIPSSIHVIPVGAHYFGVDSISNYIASLFKLYVIDSIADEIPVDIIGDKYKEASGYYEALDYVRATENRASLYNVTGTGGSSFKAWIEPAEISAYSLATAAGEPDFELSIDNGTGTMDENGVLSFTGSGTLSVTPRSQVPGVLCIEMEDGTVARYPMTVAEEHECGSEEWHVALAPTDTMNGFRVKFCDVCGEILDMGEMVACKNHVFAGYEESQSPTLDAAGVNVRTCIHCGCAEYDYTDAYALNGYIYRFESGTTVEEITTFFNEKGMEVSMDDFDPADWAATGYTLEYEGKQYQIVISGDIDGDAEVTIFDLLEVADHINGESELTGAGLEAALSDIYESELTIFDAISIADQVNDAQ